MYSQTFYSDMFFENAGVYFLRVTVVHSSLGWVGWGLTIDWKGVKVHWVDFFNLLPINFLHYNQKWLQIQTNMGHAMSWTDKGGHRHVQNKTNKMHTP